MPSLLTSNVTSLLTGALINHFDTFTHDRTRLVIINKEPIKTIINISSAPAYGYNEASNQTNITYTPVSGVFPAMINYDLNQKTVQISDAKNNLSKGQVRIKVERAAKDFIDDGRKNESIVFDNKVYDLISNFGVQNYLGLVYYIYQLENTL